MNAEQSTTGPQQLAYRWAGVGFIVWVDALEGLGYLLPDLAPACWIAALGGLAYRRGVAWKVAEICPLTGLALLASLAHALLARTGSVLDWSLFRFTLRNLDELGPPLASETGLGDLILIAGPACLLLAPHLPVLPRQRGPVQRPRFRRLFALGLGGLGCWLGSLLLVPQIPRHPQFRLALLGPFLRLEEAANPRAELIELLPDPASLRAGWEQRRAGAPRPNIMFVLLESVRASAVTPTTRHCRRILLPWRRPFTSV